MPLRVSINRERRLVRTVWEGRVGREEVASYYDAVLAPGALYGFDEIADARAVIGTALSPGDFRDMAKAAAGFLKDRPVTRLAVVVDKDVFFGLARMYGALAELAGDHRDIKPFRRIEDAEAWMDRAAVDAEEP